MNWIEITLRDKNMENRKDFVKKGKLKKVYEMIRITYYQFRFSLRQILNGKK